jgi:hypothetical protein
MSANLNDPASPEQPKSPWLCPGPEKERWKSEGNRYSPEQLKQMEAEAGLVIQEWSALRIE